MWGRQVYRWSDIDFEANAKEGIAIDWPIRYTDIAPWYTYVEKFVGVSGEKLGLPQLPDGSFLKPMELNCVEKHAREQIEKIYLMANDLTSKEAVLPDAVDRRQVSALHLAEVVGIMPRSGRGIEEIAVLSL